MHYGAGVTRDDPSPDIPPPPGGLPPADDHEVVDQDELRPPLPPLDTGTAAPMPDVAPGPESPMPPLDAPGVSPDLPAGPAEPEGDLST